MLLEFFKVLLATSHYKIALSSITTTRIDIILPMQASSSIGGQQQAAARRLRDLPILIEDLLLP